MHGVGQDDDDGIGEYEDHTDAMVVVMVMMII